MQNDSQRCKIETESFNSISCGVTELLRKVSKGGNICNNAPPPGDVGISKLIVSHLKGKASKFVLLTCHEKCYLL